ncbi:hypothetical protein CQA62_02240 [Helicobacter cholecystus]|uniref:DUF5666 domain-containing protein n=1 Tax=Helicobacter cholecystus TaxID=45498 RepID=A0A3D8IWY7_9HELI|nr:DUF5666 domain-containing protein [Helicobacter cholecystus]RDU69490.1 hypothetical protein CQA62_02240 [Helicobacter cholecystus]VEJ24041.1 Uncharacterised protein [Helicobacter cholecystus]
MKKLLLTGMLVGVSAFASDITGIIQKIDNAQKTITLNGNTIKVMPYTKIEQDSCGIGWDTPKKFSDLKVGDLIEVDFMHSQGGLVAEDIEIKCMKNQAY